MRREVESGGGAVRDWGENMIINYKKNIVKQKIVLVFRIWQWQLIKWHFSSSAIDIS